MGAKCASGVGLFIQHLENLQDDWTVVLEDLYDLLLGVVEVGLSFQAKGADTLSIVHSCSLNLRRESTVVFLVVVQGDHDLVLALVSGNTPVSGSSVGFFTVLGVLSELLGSLGEYDLIFLAVFEFDHQLSSLFLHELVWISVFLGDGFSGQLCSS